MENNKILETLKVYSLLLEAKDQVFLSIQYASSLEEAFIMAKLEYEQLNPTKTGVNNPFLGSKIWLFTIKSVADLVNGVVKVPKAPMKFKRLILEDEKKENEVQKVITETIKENLDIKKNKNNLMQKIIKEKDKELLNQSKELLTQNDIKYIEETLEKKEDSTLDK